MVTGKKGRPLGANIYVADGVFNRVVLRILLSEFDESQEKTTFGIKVSCCARGMSVVITGTEI